MRKMLLPLLAALAPLAFSAHAAEPLRWPADGSFPAYPAEPPDGHLWHIYAIGDVTHDSNLFRLSDSTDTRSVLGTSERSDTIYSAGARVRGDIPISRQHVIVDVTAIQHKFQRFGFLDYVGHDATLTWNWQAGNLWNGKVGYQNRRYLSSFATLQDRVQDLIDENHAFASAARMIHPRWKVQGAVDYYHYTHSADSRSTLDNRVATGTADLLYVTPADNTAGIEAKVSDGSYPNREVVRSLLIDNRYREYEVSGTVHWAVTAASLLEGRAGYTRRVHDDVSARDFGGGTYNLEYKWTPLASTIFHLSGYREIRSYTDVAANYILTDGVSAGASWAVTYRTVLQLNLTDERWKFLGDPGLSVAGTSLRRDHVRAATVSAGYMPWRNTRLEVAYERGIRDSNVNTASYDYNMISGTVRVQF